MEFVLTNIFLLVLNIMSYIVLAVYGGTATGEDLQRIRKYLLNKTDYDPEIIPKKDGPVNVTITVDIIDMVPRETAPLHFSTQMYLEMSWNDYRLTYDSIDGSNDTALPFSYKMKDKIWTPPIYFIEAKEGSQIEFPQPNLLLEIFPNGTVQMQLRLFMHSFCPMKMTYYPFDIQKCNITIEPYSYNENYMRLFWSQNAPESNLYNTEFNIITVDYDSSRKYYERHGNYSQVIMKFKLYRYLLVRFFHDFFPCIMIVILSWVNFWINYKSIPARVALGITTILTVVTMTNNVRENSPPVGLFRSSDIYMLMCNLYVFAALGEYAVVGMTEPRFGGIQKSEESEKKKEMKKNTNMLTSPCNSIGMEENVEEKKESCETKLKWLVLIANEEPHIVDKISRIIFPLSFIAVNAIYFIFHRVHPDTVD